MFREWSNQRRQPYFFLLEQDKKTELNQRVQLRKQMSDWVILPIILLIFICLFNVLPLSYASIIAIVLILFFVLFKFIFVTKWTVPLFLIFSFLPFLLMIDVLSNTQMNQYIEEPAFFVFGFLLNVIFWSTIYFFSFPIYMIERLSLHLMVWNTFLVIAFTLFIMIFPWLVKYQNQGNWELERADILESGMPNDLMEWILANESNLNAINAFLDYSFRNFLQDIMNSYVIISVTFYFFVLTTVKQIRLQTAKSKASKLYRSLIIQSNPEYELIKKCAYLGGDSMEQLLLSNPLFKEVIIKNESHR